MCILKFQGSEGPLYLPVGTEVSAKYRGAFCEAKVKKVVKCVKCKVRFIVTVNLLDCYLHYIHSVRDNWYSTTVKLHQCSCFLCIAGAIYVRSSVVKGLGNYSSTYNTFKRISTNFRKPGLGAIMVVVSCLLHSMVPVHVLCLFLPGVFEGEPCYLTGFG